MAISVFDLFTIGIGPSSSHTVGPMRAARTFASAWPTTACSTGRRRVEAQLFGSLGATGHGHGSDRAVLLGLEGEDPETVDTDTVDARVEPIRERGRLLLPASTRSRSTRTPTWCCTGARPCRSTRTG